VAAGLVTVLALASVWHAAAPTWRKLNADYRAFSAYSELQRDGAASANAGFNPELFAALASSIDDDDRVYFQVPRRPYGTLDLHDTFAALGRYYLAPAVEVTDPDDATVVVSYEADPADLGREILLQRQLGPRIFVSRLESP
jgi:hypothetical protein